MQFNHSRLTLQKFWEELPYEVPPKSAVFLRKQGETKKIQVKKPKSGPPGNIQTDRFPYTAQGVTTISRSGQITDATTLTTFSKAISSATSWKEIPSRVNWATYIS